MGKYDPLATYLRRRRAETVELSFRETENLIGGLLPNATAADAWWSPDHAPRPGVQHAAWTGAGFAANKVAKERVAFRRGSGTA